MAREDYEGGYRIDEILTRSQDEHGHSANLRVHVPVPWRALMEQVCQSDAWPEYRSIQDIVRDSLYHRLHWVSGQKEREAFPEVRAAMMQVRLERQLSYITESARMWREFSERIEETLTTLAAANDWEIVKNFCDDAAEEIDDVPQPYRGKLAAQLDMWKRRADREW